MKYISIFFSSQPCNYFFSSHL